MSLGASVADAVAALSTDEEKETLVIAGGALLLDGLLAAAAGRSRGEERDAAERALLNLLATGVPPGDCPTPYLIPRHYSYPCSHTLLEACHR